MPQGSGAGGIDHVLASAHDGTSYRWQLAKPLAVLSTGRPGFAGKFVAMHDYRDFRVITCM